MSKMKGTIFNLLILTLLIVGMNYIYTKYFFEADLQKHSDLINYSRNVAERGDEIVYIGESSNITYRGNDVDKRKISGFLADFFPDKKVGDITKEASHAGIYYELLRNIPIDAPVETVVVTLNLRSFGADWIYSKLETPLQKSIVLLKEYPPLFNRFILSFKGYDIKTDKERNRQVKKAWRKSTLEFPYPFPYKTVVEWDDGRSEQGVFNKDNTKNFELTALACNYIKTYAFQIDVEKNPRIKDFDKIVKLAKERNWNLIFNLLAENTEKAEKLVGNDLLFLMRQNRDLLLSRYQQQGVVVVDNLEAVSDKEFIDQDWTTEHYAENGRKIIAYNVAQSLKQFYPDNYVDVEYDLKKQNEFFNNCEGTVIWNQMQTFSKEQAYSPTTSSKTNKEQPYSITFEYSPLYLTDSLRYVNIEMLIYQTDTLHDAQIVFELSGGVLGYTWLSDLVVNSVKQTNEWVRKKSSFKLPNEFYACDLLKIYLYNPTNTNIYVDDVHILFEK